MFAADAVARMTGSVGVAVLTAGPGVTNSVTAVKNAQMAESPVLLIGRELFIYFNHLFAFLLCHLSLNGSLKEENK